MVGICAAVVISSSMLAEFCVVLAAIMITEWMASSLGPNLSKWIAFGSYFQVRKDPMTGPQRV